jgi:hypothetical protein
MSKGSHGSSLTDAALHLRHLTAGRVSTTNLAHGVHEKEEHYKTLFQQMLGGAGSEMAGKKVFLAYAAGFYSGDGCIQVYSISLVQSNVNFLNAFAFFLHQICDVSLIRATPNTSQQTHRSGTTLQTFTLAYRDTEDISKLCRTVGLFDYGRRVQWLLVLLFTDIQLAPGRTKGSIYNEVDRREIEFIKALLSLAKKILES